MEPPCIITERWLGEAQGITQEEAASSSISSPNNLQPSTKVRCSYYSDMNKLDVKLSSMSISPSVQNEF